MVRARVRGKRKAPIFKSKPKSENATDSATTEATANEPVKTDAEAPHLVSRTEENKEENKGEEVKKGNVNKLRKRSRRKTERSSGTETVKDAVKPENLDRKKGSKKVESMGMIFMCNSKTKKDCYRYKVLGLPASKKDIVAKVYKGMRLFLFDIDLKLIYGIYKAAGPGGYNIEPKAFKSAFPSQVRFTVLDDFLPLAEEKFKKVVKDNYYGKNKFNCQLNSEQVKNLCKLFRLTSKSGNSKRVGRTSRQEAYKVAEQGRSRWQSQDAVRHSPFGGNQLYQEGPNMYEREVFRSPEQGTRLRSQDGVRHSPLGGSLLYSEGPRRYQREAFPSSEQDRSMWRIQDGVRHTPLDGNSFYPEGLGMYEREAFPLPVLAPPPLRHPYVYEVPSDMNYYRRDTHLEHHGHGLYDFEHRLRKKTESQDAYSIYRQPPPYRDPLYSVAPPPEYRRVPSPPPPLLYRY